MATMWAILEKEDEEERKRLFQLVFGKYRGEEE